MPSPGPTRPRTAAFPWGGRGLLSERRTCPGHPVPGAGQLRLPPSHPPSRLYPGEQPPPRAVSVPAQALSAPSHRPEGQVRPQQPARAAAGESLGVGSRVAQGGVAWGQGICARPTVPALQGRGGGLRSPEGLAPACLSPTKDTRLSLCAADSGVRKAG